MSGTVTIVGRTGCGACIFTKRALELARISYVLVDVDENATAAATARHIADETRSTQLPIVIGPDGATWTGLRLDRIAELVRAE